MSDDLYDGPCEAGCMHFHGGEVRHHKDCGHYPDSLTKLNADRIEQLVKERDHAWKMVAEADARLGQSLGDTLEDKQKLAKAVEALQVLSCKCTSNCFGCDNENICPSWTAHTALSELEGKG